jgi:curli biogenesis system outer membrane secretion channel CsgG
VLLAPPALAAAKPKESREQKLKKPRLAILDFRAADGAWHCAGWGNSERRMSDVLRDLFTTEISDRARGKLRLVERERLEAVRGELAFQQGGEVDAATAQQLGKLLGVRYMLTGKITRFACKKSGASTGWGVGALVGRATKSGLAGSVAGSVKTANVKFSGRLDVRLVDTQSGEILATFKDEEDTSDTSVKVAGGGTDVAYDDELASKVFEPIVARLAPKIVKRTGLVHEESLAEEEEAGEASPPAKKAASSDDDE